MALPNSSSPEVLAEEILATARREHDEVLRRAEEQAQKRLAEAAAEAHKLRRERLAQAQAEADRRTELTLATVPVEAGRARSEQIEVLLESCRGEVRRKLRAREGFEYGQILAQLATEAIGHMAGEQFVVKLSPADYQGYRAGLVETIVKRVNRSPLEVTVAEDPTMKGGGLLVEDLEGRQLWDNRLESRLERLWPEMRRQLAAQAGLVDLGHSEGGST